MFDEVDGFIKIYDGIRYLALFDYGWFDKILEESELIHIILYL